jgi:hypothetical protein
VAGLRELLQEIYLGLTTQHDGRVVNQHCVIHVFERSRVSIPEEGITNWDTSWFSAAATSEFRDSYVIMDHKY